MNELNDYFDREGQITDLTLERFLADDPDLSPEIIELIEADPAYQEKIEARRTENAAFSIRPPSTENTHSVDPSNVVSLDSRRPVPWGVVGAIAAILLVGLSAIFVLNSNSSQAPDHDIVRIKGKQFSIQTYLNTETGPFEIQDGETIKPGDRIGFKTKNATEGFLLILGRDDGGTFYPVYPQRGASNATFIAAAPDGRDLKAAVKFDAAGSRETIIAAFCTNSFSANDLRERLDQTANKNKTKQPLADCSLQTLNFTKSSQ